MSEGTTYLLPQECHVVWNFKMGVKTACCVCAIKCPLDCRFIAFQLRLQKQAFSKYLVDVIGSSYVVLCCVHLKIGIKHFTPEVHICSGGNMLQFLFIPEGDILQCSVSLELGRISDELHGRKACKIRKK